MMVISPYKTLSPELTFVSMVAGGDRVHFAENWSEIGGYVVWSDGEGGHHVTVAVLRESCGGPDDITDFDGKEEWS